MYVDRPVRRQGVVLLGTLAQHALEPIGPVGAHAFDIDPIPRQPRRVGDHRHHGRCDRHRIPVCDDERGIGKGVDQGWELLKVLRCLEDPPGSASEPLQNLEDSAEVGVRRSLITGQIGITPGGHGSCGLEEHGGEVDGQELNLLVGVLDRHFVHAVEVGQRSIEKGERHVRALQARVGGTGLRPVTRSRQDRFQALPVGERPQRGVGRQEVVEMRRARAGEPADDDRCHNLLVEDLGMSSNEVLDEQPVLQQAEDEDVLLHDAGAIEAALAAHGVAEHGRVVRRSRRHPKSIQAGFGAGDCHELRRIERQAATPPPP